MRNDLSGRLTFIVSFIDYMLNIQKQTIRNIEKEQRKTANETTATILVISIDCHVTQIY